MGGILRKHEKDQIGFRELFAIIFLTLGAKSTDMSTVFLFRDGLNAAWMIVIGSSLLIIPSLLLLNNVLKKYPSKNILEVTQLTLGKRLTFIIALFMFFFALMGTANESRSYMTQLITINFPNTPLFILYLCFLILCMWGAMRGWETIGSIAWMILPYLLLALGLLIFLMLRESVFNRIFPLFGPGIWAIAKASFNYTSIFSEPFILALMYPLVKNHRTYTRSMYSSLLFTVSIMVIIYLSYIWMFDYRSIDKLTFPYNEAIRYVSLGKTITNIDTFFITFWLIAVFVKFTVYIYLLCKIFGFIFQVQDFEHTIIPITLLILIIGMIPENNEFNMFVVRREVLGYFKYLLLFLPPLLWTVTKIRGVKEK